MHTRLFTLPSTNHSMMFMTTVLATANLQDVWPYNDDVDMWSIEWDSANVPSENYPQEYDRMAVIMTSLVDILGKQVLQWAFLTNGQQ